MLPSSSKTSAQLWKPLALGLCLDALTVAVSGSYPPPGPTALALTLAAPGSASSTPSWWSPLLLLLVLCTPTSTLLHITASLKSRASSPDVCAPPSRACLSELTHSVYDCIDAVEQGVAQITEMLQSSSGIQQLEQTFNTCGSIDPDNHWFFELTLMGTTFCGSLSLLCFADHIRTGWWC